MLQFWFNVNNVTTKQLMKSSWNNTYSANKAGCSTPVILLMDRWDCQTSATPEHCPLVMMKMVFCVRLYASSYCMVLHGKVWYPTIDGGIDGLIDRWYCMVWHAIQCIAMILNEANKWRIYNMIWGFHQCERCSMYVLAPKLWWHAPRQSQKNPVGVLEIFCVSGNFWRISTKSAQN